MSASDDSLIESLVRQMIPILNQIAAVMRSSAEIEYRVKVKNNDGVSLECFVVDGRVTDESLSDLVADLVQRYMDDKWRFIPLADLSLKFADDPPCDLRSCWYLAHRDRYKEYTGSYCLRYRHQRFSLCDRCKEEASYYIERAYRRIIQSVSTTVLNTLKDKRYIG